MTTTGASTGAARYEPWTLTIHRPTGKERGGGARGGGGGGGRRQRGPLRDQYNTSLN